MVKGSKPLKRRAGSISGTLRGGKLESFSEIAFIWSGVVPQQPPAKLSNPSSAKMDNELAVSSGFSS